MSVMKSSTSFCIIIVMITVRSSPAQHSVHTGGFILFNSCTSFTKIVTFMLLILYMGKLMFSDSYSSEAARKEPEEKHLTYHIFAHQFI